MKILLDTNILISASISNGKPRMLLIKGIGNEFTIVASKQLMKELGEVLTRPKFNLSLSEITKFLSTVKRTVKLVKVKSGFNVIENDPDDNIVINTAYDAKADYIVTGDPDLLDLGEFRGIKVVTVNEMLKILEDG